jgi:hypothetical protein
MSIAQDQAALSPFKIAEPHGSDLGCIEADR